MHKPQQMVQEFHRVIGQPTSPAKPELRSATLRAQLIIEEAIETAFALVGAPTAQNIIHDQLIKVLQLATQKGELDADLCRAIDGICDVVVVAYGSAEAIGVDLEPFFDEVQKTNLAKVGGEVINGKLQKPKGWTPPRIKEVLEKVMEARS